MTIAPRDVRYIKLGDSGRWADQSISEGTISFGYHSIPHDVCMRKDWDQVWQMLDGRKSPGAQTAGVTEVSSFYEMGDDCLWITFASGLLYWSFAHPDVSWVGDGSDGGPSRVRQTVDGWRSADLNGKPLRIAGLSSKLTKVGNYRAAICRVAEEAYLVRRINGIEEPIIQRANEARNAMMAVAVDMIRHLHWADFETLTDLIFARSGWQRFTRVGGSMADVDMLLEQPTTGEIAFVQVKSQAAQGTLDESLRLFRSSGYDRFFFVCHTAHGQIVPPTEKEVHLFEGERLANAAVKSGLFDWLVERSG